MYLGTFEIYLLKYMTLALLVFLWQAASRKTKVKLDLLTDIEVLLMIEKGIRGEKWHAIYQYVKDKEKYKKNYYKNKESSYLKFWNVNNLCGWVKSQRLPLGNFKWVKETTEFNEDFIKSYNDDSDKEYFLEIYIQYPENLHNLPNNLPFLPKRMNIERVQKLLDNLHNK